MLDVLITNGYVITQNPEMGNLKMNIGIKDGKIAYLGPEKKEAQTYIEAKNKLVVPGFINSHIHFGEYFLKGYEQKFSTEQYIEYAEQFNKTNEPLKEKIRLVSTKITLLESLKYGTTTFMGIRGWDCAENYPLRLYMGYPLMKSAKLGNYLDNASENIKALKNSDLIEYFIALHSIKWVDEETLQEVSELYHNMNNIKLSVHVCETKAEVDYIKEKFNMTPIEVMAKYKLLSPRTLLVHCNYLSDADFALIKKHNCSVAVCPNSNMKLGNKVADIEKLFNAEINVMIATDGPATNDSLNLLDSCRTAGLITNLTSEQILSMITSNCEQYFHNSIGSIAIGKKADIIMFEKNNTVFLRPETYTNNLIYSGGIIPSDVIINGQPIVNNYQNQIMDYTDIYNQKEDLIKSLI